MGSSPSPVLQWVVLSAWFSSGFCSVSPVGLCSQPGSPVGFCSSSPVEFCSQPGSPVGICSGSPMGFCSQPSSPVGFWLSSRFLRWLSSGVLVLQWVLLSAWFSSGFCSGSPVGFCSQSGSPVGSAPSLALQWGSGSPVGSALPQRKVTAGPAAPLAGPHRDRDGKFPAFFFFLFTNNK